MEHYFEKISKQEAINLTIVELAKISELFVKARENPDVLNFDDSEFKKYYKILCDFQLDCFYLFLPQERREKLLKGEMAF